MNGNMLKRGKRQLCFVMITMLLAGLLKMPVHAAESGISEPVFEHYGEETTDNVSGNADKNPDVEVTNPFYMVTLNADGGVFVGEYDDVLNERIETTEILNKLISAGDTVKTIPVYFDGDEERRFTGWSMEANGALISEADLSYAPSGDCILYAVWDLEEVIETPVSGEDEPFEEEGKDNPADNNQTVDGDELEKTGEDSIYIPEDAQIAEGQIDGGSGDNEESCSEDISYEEKCPRR